MFTQRYVNIVDRHPPTNQDGTTSIKLMEMDLFASINFNVRHFEYIYMRILASLHEC